MSLLQELLRVQIERPGALLAGSSIRPNRSLKTPRPNLAFYSPCVTVILKTQPGGSDRTTHILGLEALVPQIAPCWYGGLTHPSYTSCQGEGDPGAFPRELGCRCHQYRCHCRCSPGSSSPATRASPSQQPPGVHRMQDVVKTNTYALALHEAVRAAAWLTPDTEGLRKPSGWAGSQTRMFIIRIWESSG